MVIKMLFKRSILTVMLLACTLAFVSAFAAAAPINDHTGTADNGGYVVSPAKSVKWKCRHPDDIRYDKTGGD